MGLVWLCGGGEMNDWYEDLPKEVKPDLKWESSTLLPEIRMVFRCNFCTAIVTNPKQHLLHSQRCMVDLIAEADKLRQSK